MTLVVSRIVHDVSYSTRMKHAIDFAWQVTLVAPRIVNDVSYATRIKHASDFAWQVQYLVRLEGDTCCSAHCK